MTAFSVTERGTFKRCPRQWDLTSLNRQKLGPIVPPLYLGVGTLIHKASQAWLLDPESIFEDHVMLAADAMLTEAHARYEAQVGVKMDKVEEDVLYESIHFATAMAHNYQIRWGSPLPEGYRIIRPEQKVSVPVKATAHVCEVCNGHGRTFPSLTEALPCTNCNGEGFTYHHLEGRFDGLVVDDSGRIFILEHKTYKARPKPEVLQSNDQFLAYIWLARQLGIGEVVGLAYDGMWRRDSVPKGKTFEDLFMRTTIIRPEHEIAEFGHYLPSELNAMARTPENPYLNRRWEGCYDCGVEKLCSAMSRGEDTDYIRRAYFTERTPELEAEAEAESGSDPVTA